MSRLLNGSIDVNKIDKSKLIDGKKGKYLNIAIWINDEVDQFGNIASIQQGMTKEERESGAPKIYLGNAKEFVKGGSNSSPAASSAPAGADNDLPF